MHNREITHIVKAKFYENTMQKLDLRHQDSFLITSLCIEYIG